MEVAGAIRVEKAEREVHLLPCPGCGNDDAALVQYAAGQEEPWKVCCFGCGFAVDAQSASRMDAEAAWNHGVWEIMDKPCKGCQDRYIACSDHCRKPAYLQWRLRLERRRELDAKKREIDNYTVREILKNRRTK